MVFEKIEGDELPIVRKKVHLDDLYSEYKKVVRNLRATPQNIGCYQEIFDKILSDYAESHGELLVSNDGKANFVLFVTGQGSLILRRFL